MDFENYENNITMVPIFYFKSDQIKQKGGLGIFAINVVLL